MDHLSCQMIDYYYLEITGCFINRFFNNLLQQAVLLIKQKALAEYHNTRTFRVLPGLMMSRVLRQILNRLSSK